MLKSKSAKIDLFDEVALHALEVLFWFCYPKYLIYKGDQKTEKVINNLKPNWELFITGNYIKDCLEDEGGYNEKMPMSQRIWELVKSLFIGDSIQWEPTKECLVAALSKQKPLRAMKRAFKVRC